MTPPPKPEADNAPAKRPARTRRRTAPRWPLVRPAAWLIVIASYAVILFAFLFPHDFRHQGAAYTCAAWTAFMIRTFLFHLGLLLLLVAALAATLRRWRLLIATAPLLLFTAGPALWSCVPKPGRTASGPTVTVMSINLLGANRNTAGIVEEVRAADPDILLLLEYRAHWHAAFSAALGDHYPHFTCVQREDNFGMAFYARTPLAEPVDMTIPLGAAGTPQMRAVVRIGSRNVALYGVHLMPPRGRAATLEQRREFADLLDRLETELLPVILCGDFNFTSASPFADALRRRGLTDSHQLAGRGRGTTWPVLGFFRWLPGLRLDHIFLSSELTSLRSVTGIGQGSDHRPVLAQIGLRSANESPPRDVSAKGRLDDQ